MGAQFWEVVCGEHGVGGDGEYCVGNDAQLGLIGAVRASPLARARCSSLFRPGNLVSETAGAGINLATPGHVPRFVCVGPGLSL
jgi:hypothetical protein